MTKDRRLGRGLAALLGTPLEEDQIVEGVNLPASAQAKTPPDPSNAGSAMASTASARLPVGNIPPVTIPAGNAAENPNRIAAVASQAKESEKQRVELSRPNATRSVTGAVPLAKPTQTGNAHGCLELNVHEIDNNPFQPRRKFNDEEIASLAASICEHQQLQPILVRRVGSRYQLISGERRLRASIHAGLPTIRAELREADDRLVAELAIVENLQRKDLDPIEKALSFRRYIDQHQCTQDDLAKRLKIDRSTIANLMRLLELPDAIQEWVQADKITAGHARTLLPLGDEEQQLDFARRIKAESWTVRETERRVAQQLDSEDGVVLPETPPSPKGSRKRTSPQIAALEQKLRLSLGTKAEIRQNAAGRGKIVITFANPDEFERICHLILPEPQNKAA